MMNKGLRFANYIVGFVDILGQRVEYKDETILPNFKNEDEKQIFIEKQKNTIGVIILLRKSAEQMIESARSHRSSYRNSLSEPQQSIYDLMKKDNLQRQCWSDSLVYFSSLEKKDDYSEMGSVLYLLQFTGYHCLQGLAINRPVRGGVEIGWGVELTPGEIAGNAMVKAYELESKVAQYPRIVIGEYAIKYIKDIANGTAAFTPYDVLNKNLAQVCLNFLEEDSDGRWIINYLGPYFQTEIFKELYDDAQAFILKTLENCRKNNDTKHTLRYEHLRDFFIKHKLPT